MAGAMRPWQAGSKRWSCRRSRSCRLPSQRRALLIIVAPALVDVAAVAAPGELLANGRQDRRNATASNPAGQRKMAQKDQLSEPFLMYNWRGWQESNPRPLGS
jgi:hypothetical protein